MTRPIKSRIGARRVRFPTTTRITSGDGTGTSTSSRTTTQKSRLAAASLVRQARPTQEISPVEAPPRKSLQKNQRQRTPKTAAVAMTTEQTLSGPAHIACPLIRDALETETSQAQDATVRACLPLLNAVDSKERLPRLLKEKHIAFLHRALGALPAGFVVADATRPWLLYWALTGLCILGEDISPYRDRVMATLAPMQNYTGGFGGGHGQLSHCATSYAAVLSLILVDGEEMINREALWEWLGQLKQPDGGFTLCIGGEEDVRGAYCAMVMISLLQLRLELPPNSPARRASGDTFLTQLPEYLSRCQTYEGGISGSPGNESHGAYAFCALACLCILGHPRETLFKYLDFPRLVSWLSARQYSPEGGFAGRTNKLVDGCYSHWVGGCWPLVEAALEQLSANGPGVHHHHHHEPTTLHSREALAKYILCCCQDKRGGLRDKPGKPPDAYHSCYVLAGLSSVQHQHSYSEDEAKACPLALAAAFGWLEPVIGKAGGEAREQALPQEEEDRLCAVHPLFLLPWARVEKLKHKVEVVVSSS